MSYSIVQDWNSNERNIKGRLILIGFRLANLGKQNKLLFILLVPHLIIYRILVEWILGVELPWKTTVGEGLVLHHGQALVVNDGSIIGSNCTLRHSTTIGSKRMADGSFSKSPVIGNNVDVGSNVCIIGAIKIGNNVKIGAGSVVVKDVPDFAVIAGNPARIITYLPSNTVNK